MKKLDLIRLIIVIAMVFGFVYQTRAQSADRKWALGAYASILEYRGDIGSEFFKFKFGGYKDEIRGGISIAKYMSPSFDLMGRFTLGELNYKGVCKNLDSYFDATYISSNVNLVYKFYNGYLLPEDFIIQPYVTVGVGGFWYAVSGVGASWSPSLGHEGQDISYGQKKKIITPGDVYGGLGFKIRASKAVGFVVQMGLHYPLSDRLDGIRDMTSKPAYDAILEHSLGVTYSIANAVDSDGDGVPDNRDRCPDTPADVKVDKWGCAIDSDGDGIPDYKDECPYEAGLLKFKGCPDTDGDNIPDKDDQCPYDAGLKKFKGCPDTDRDAIPDKDDECPDMAGPLEMKGCPCDYEAVKYCGDDDKDGVPNSKDKCPTTAPGRKVNADGCEDDTDGDGIPDLMDKCPDVPGAKDADGCPAVQTALGKWMNAAETVKFNTAKWDILPKSAETLDQLAKIMSDNPKYVLKISAYTDNVGTEDYNMDLSKKRAKSTKDYLVSKGIDGARITADGYGETNFIATNATEPGKQLNRRSEFKLSLP